MAPTVIDPNDLSGTLQSFSDRLDTLEKVGAIPVGLVAYCAGVVPDGWLLANGGTFDSNRYGQLSQYLGGGVTLPNLAGRVIVGQNAATFATMLSTGGVETVTLTSAQIPAHTHTASVTDPTHAHGVPISSSAGGTIPASPGNGAVSTNYASQGASTGISVTVNANTGGGGSHTNLQPYIVLLPIIKF